MSKTLSLQNFLREAGQLCSISSTSQGGKKETYQLTCLNLWSSLWSSNYKKKLNVLIILKFSFQFEIFCENHFPTRHIKYKVINFAPSNKSIVASKLSSTNSERFLGWIKSPLTR